MTEQEWSFGDVDSGGHFIQATSESGQVRLMMDEQDVLIVRNMLNRVVNEEGYDAAEAFGTDTDDPDPVTDGGPDHDVPVSGQLTDRQQALVEDTGGPDDA